MYVNHLSDSPTFCILMSGERNYIWTISSLALGKCVTYSTTRVYKGNVSNITCNYYCLFGGGIPYLLHLHVDISSYEEFAHITFCEGLPIVWFYF